jgi:2-hydroxy-6-oxonona-2,4-dienedioate hydrolase
MSDIPIKKTYVIINDRKIYSVIYGTGFPVIFLLGWLNDGDRYAFLRYIKTFSAELQKYQFHFVHLSNFYKSSYSEMPLSLDDYIDEVRQYAQSFEFKKFHLVGHSAGGRIAIGFALQHPSLVSKLVLLDSAGLNTREPSRRQVTFAHISFSKFWATRPHRDILQQTYRNLFTTSLKCEIPTLKLKTLIIWGGKDKTIPISHAHRFHSLIPHSQLEILEHRDHMTIHDPETFVLMFNFFNDNARTSQTASPFVPDLDTSFRNPVLKSYRETYLRLADNKTYREFFTLPIPKAELDEFDGDSVHTLQALQRFAAYVVAKDPSILDELQLGHLDIDGIKARDCKDLFNYARIDTIYDGRKFWFIEVNARRPQMYEDADWFSQMLQAAHISARRETSTNDIADSIIAQYRLHHTHSKPMNIFLVSENPKWDYPYSLVNQLKEDCPKSHFITINANIPHFSCVTYAEFLKHCSIDNHQLYFDDMTVDLIVLQNLCGGSSLFYTQGGIKSDLVREAYLAGTLEISSPPSALIIGSKLSLAFITDPAMQKTLKFSKDVVKSLRRFPKTTVATSHTVDIDDGISYVLKSTKSISGGGVIMKGSVTSPDSLRYYVRQQRVEYGCREIVTWNDSITHEAGVTIEPFVVNNPLKSKIPFVTGYSARAIRKEHLGRIKKFNPADNVPEILFGNVVAV